MSITAWETDHRPDDTIGDAVVIGGGAAGLSGALMLARSRRSVVVVDSGDPRNAPAGGVRGLLGLDGITPAKLLHRGREEVVHYGGRVLAGEVVSAVAAAPARDGDLRFAVGLADGRVLHAAGSWSPPVCVTCSRRSPAWRSTGGTGWCTARTATASRSVTRPSGCWASGPHRSTRSGCSASRPTTWCTSAGGPTWTRTPAPGSPRGGSPSSTPGSRGSSRTTAASPACGWSMGGVVPRRVLAVATTMVARTDGLDGLGLPVADLPNGMGRHLVSGMAGTTQVPGVWVAGNATELHAQVGASAAAGALAGSHINAHLAAADTAAALHIAGRLSSHAS